MTIDNLDRFLLKLFVKYKDGDVQGSITVDFLHGMVVYLHLKQVKPDWVK